MLEKSDSGRSIRKDSFESIVGPQKVEDALHYLYCDRLMSTTEVAAELTKMFGIDVGAAKVYGMLNRLGVVRNKSEALSIKFSTDKNSVGIDNDLRAIIDGMLLGDGSMSINNRGDRARIGIGSVHREFASYCQFLLSPMISSVPEFTEPGDTGKGGRGMWSTQTIHQDGLAEIYKKWYINGVKVVPEDVNLDPMSLMLWYLGDGSLSAMNDINSRSLYFSTNSFSRDEIVNILAKGLYDRYGVEYSRITSDNRLFIKTKSIWPLLKAMGGESPVECFSYKFDIEEWRKWRSMRDVANSLNIDYGRLSNWVKRGKIDHNRSPGGKKVMFDNAQVSALLKRIDSGELSREKGKKARVPIIYASDNLKFKEMRQRDGEDKASFVNRVVETYQNHGFPYVSMGYDERIKKWTSVKKSQYVIPEDEIIKWRKPGLSLAESFHSHIYNVDTGKDSPLRVFEDKDLFSQCIGSFMDMSGKNNLTYADVRRALCRFGGRKANSFSPHVVRDLVNFYGHQGCSVLDPCAGYSGRLLGTVASKHYPSYFGIDPCLDTCNGLLDTKRFLSMAGEESEISIVNGCAEDILRNVRDSSFDMGITSPPYWSKEKYSKELTQSYVRYNTYGKWVKGFLEPVVSGCFRAIKPGGVLLFNVGPCGNHDIPLDTSSIAEKSGFIIEDVKRIRFRKAFSKGVDNIFFYEPLFVFRKP